MGKALSMDKRLSAAMRLRRRKARGNVVSEQIDVADTSTPLPTYLKDEAANSAIADALSAHFLFSTLDKGKLQVCIGHMQEELHVVGRPVITQGEWLRD